MKITAELRNWEIHSNDWGQYATGRIFNDEKNRWRDGTYIHTSQIKTIVPALDGLVLITRNSSYLIRAGSEAYTEVLASEATLLAFA